MRKKRFFAKAFAFAALSGLLAVAPLGEKVQRIAAEEASTEGSTPGTQVPSEEASVKDIFKIKITGTDNKEVVDTTYQFTRTSKDTITVIKDGTRDAYYKFESGGESSTFQKVGDSITVPVDMRNKDSVSLKVSEDTNGTNAQSITVSSALSAEVNYSNYTLEITPSKVDSFVFVEVLKKKSDIKASALHTYSFSETANANGVIIVDLSFLKANKESYLRVWGDRCSEKIEITVNAQPVKGRIKYNADAEFPELKQGSSGSEGADTSSNPEKDEAFQKALKKYYKSSFGIAVDAEYEIRGLYSGEWKDLFPWVKEETEGGNQYIANWDALAPLKVAGTTVILRQKAINQEYKKKEDNSDFAYDGEGNKLIEEEGMPAGVEVKVKIPASPKAPKVTIDYGKGTIKLPKNAQYGIIDANRTVQYVDAAQGGVVTPGDTLEKIADQLGLKDDPATQTMERTNFIQSKIKKGFCLIVRTNDSKKGKSNVKFVTVKSSPVITDDGWGKLFDSEGKEIATYEFKGETGVVLTFSDGEFQYEENGRWKKVISDRILKGKTAELTVRLAGVRNKDESLASWPSEKVKLEKKENKGKVGFPADAVKTLYSDGDDSESTTNPKKATYTITVTDRDGKTVDLTGANTNSNVYGVLWESSDPTVAMAEGASADRAQGTITANNPGTATITVTAFFKDGYSVKGEIEITVQKKTVQTP